MSLMREQSKVRDVRVASCALLLVPLWHLLSGSVKVPCELPPITKRHNEKGGIWWGITEGSLQEVTDSLKTRLQGHQSRFQFKFDFDIL